MHREKEKHTQRECTDTGSTQTGIVGQTDRDRATERQTYTHRGTQREREEDRQKE